MNSSNCVLSIVLLLLYVKLNSATDVDCNNVTDTLLKNLGEYTVKINELELTMENLQTKVEASLKKTEKLQDVAHGQELSIKIHEVEHMELLTNNSLVFDKFRTMIKQQEETIGTLIAEKDQLISELNVQKQINIYETTSCEAYGNDIQRIRIPGRDAFPVCCNSTFGSNEGWTVIQRRTDGTLNFDRKWDEYKNGFGDLRGEHWLGLEKVHLMTKFQPHELYIHMENYRNQTFFARYSNFLIGNETQSYEFLSLGEYTGNLENAIETGTNIKFSIRKFYGGWWFSACERCNLNGRITFDTGIWWTRSARPLRFVQMMIRPTVGPNDN